MDERPLNPDEERDAAEWINPPKRASGDPPTEPKPNRGQFQPGHRFAWKKGTSGNPLGARAPHARLARYIRKETDNGQELVDLWLRVMRNASPALRLEASRELADRGWGRPVQMTAIQRLDTFQEVCALFGQIARERLGEAAFQEIAAAAQEALGRVQLGDDPYGVNLLDVPAEHRQPHGTTPMQEG